MGIPVYIEINPQFKIKQYSQTDVFIFCNLKGEGLDQVKHIKDPRYFCCSSSMLQVIKYVRVYMVSRNMVPRISVAPCFLSYSIL